MAAASSLPPILSFPCSTRVPPAWRLRQQPMVFRHSCPPSRRRIARSAYISPPVSDPNVGMIGDDRESTGPSFSGVASETAISWGLLWSLLSKQKLGLAACFVSLLGCTTCTLSMPILSGRFFEVLVGRRTEPLLELLAKVGVLYVLEPVFTVIFVVNMSSIWEKVMMALRARVFRRILVQKVEFFDRYKVGELTGLLTSDLGSLKDVVSENISRDRGFRAFSEILGTICILFSLSTQLAPVLGLLMLSISILVAVYKRSTVPVFKSHGMAQARISDCATETFSAIRTGELSVGTMASFIGYTFTLTFAVQGGVNTIGDLRGTFAAIERINSVLSGRKTDESLAYGIEKDIRGKRLDHGNLDLLYGSDSVEQIQSRGARIISALKSSTDCCNTAWSGDICLEDVSFSYPLRSDVGVLNGLNLTLKCGKVTALVGPSGAGKSTIVQLLARFYEPIKGRITVAGEDVRTFDKSEWAEVVSIVNQEPVLFSVSVGENIAYGLPDENVSKEDVVQAAKAANAHEFIVSLPQGYDTLVGERGSLLSGGQRQRIAIARALLKNAPILILDEATSALDAVSERLVQDALNHLMKGRTTLVIAHRLSTVQNADQIAVCVDGKIVELGTHSELIAQNGQYATLVGTQRLAFK